LGELEASSLARAGVAAASGFDGTWGALLWGLFGVQPTSAHNSALAQPKRWRLSERREAHDGVTSIMRLVTPHEAKSSARRSNSYQLLRTSRKLRLTPAAREALV